MKNVYKYIIAAALVVPVAANAQQDTVLNRQVLLERDYNPTLQDASKINTMPAIYNPAIVSANARYQEKSPDITLNRNLLGKVGSGDIQTDVDYDNKKGYLILGAGTRSNIEGAFGYRLIDAPADVLNIFATHGSTSGNINYETGNDFATAKAKAKFSDSKINLSYKHLFEPSTLGFGAYYRNMSYNYYGNPYWRHTETVDTDFYDMSTRQGVNVFNFDASLESSANNNGILKYKGYAGYSYFKSDYDPIMPVLDENHDGAKGGQLDLAADFYTAFNEDNIIGVSGKIMNQSLTEPQFEFQPYEDAYHGFTNIEVTPYFKAEGMNWNVNLGVNAGYAIDSRNKFNLSPEVYADVILAGKTKLYLKATGGINENTFLQILDENRYINQMSRVGYSRTPYDISAGISSGIVRGIEFGIFGGYKQTKDDHLYVATSDLNRLFVENIIRFQTYRWGNVSTPFYADISTGHFGGLVKTSLIPRTDLSAKVIGYFYNVKYVDGYMPSYVNEIPEEEKAWGRPVLTVDVNADINILPQLDLSLGYIYAGGRKAYIGSARIFMPSEGEVSMNDVNEFNIRAQYKIVDWASVYVRANNILNQKYELIQGYTLQGFNALVGLSFKF